MWLEVYMGCHVKCLLLLSGFNETRILDRFFKNTRIANFMKVSPFGVDLFLVNGQTDRQARQSSAFRNFPKEPKNVHIYGHRESTWWNEGVDSVALNFASLYSRQKSHRYIKYRGPRGHLLWSVRGGNTGNCLAIHESRTTVLRSLIM
jgi:hypothetical protein